MTLLQEIEKGGLAIPVKIREAEALTEYAVASRYPGYQDPVDEEEHQEAVDLASRVVEWVRELFASK